MPFVAAVGSRGDPHVVAQACYFLDAATRVAETAFMVHPNWQGSGLGSALPPCSNVCWLTPRLAGCKALSQRS